MTPQIHPLRAYRAQMHVTLDALSKASGVSKSKLSKIETFRQKTTQATIEKILAVTGNRLSASDFIPNREGEPQPLPRSTRPRPPSRTPKRPS